MEPERAERRKEPRFPIQAGAVVEVNNNGRIARATTVNMSSFGTLLQFQEPLPLQVGDRVICEFQRMFTLGEQGHPVTKWLLAQEFSAAAAASGA